MSLPLKLLVVLILLVVPFLGLRSARAAALPDPAPCSADGCPTVNPNYDCWDGTWHWNRCNQCF